MMNTKTEMVLARAAIDALSDLGISRDVAPGLSPPLRVSA
jgi:uncharacterized protein YjiS (DUF1127 family)